MGEGNQEAISAKLACALDVSRLRDAEELIEEVGPHVGCFKIGLELFSAVGPAAVNLVKKSNHQCFLDLKLYDIPATMARASRSAADLGADILTVHASAGPRALNQVIAATKHTAMRIAAVTVLTSSDTAELAAVGVPGSPADHVKRLVRMADAEGVRAFVCSVQECVAVRVNVGDKAFLITPGIRSKSNQLDDQKRVASAGDAIRAGSSLLVVGRPIHGAADPGDAARQIAMEMQQAAS